MANEFKIKKGLIVTGASGGTVVDIQGSQGQLFSVTDDLSGTIFAVSDISGVPILDVNSSGLSTFDGNVNLPDSKKILLGTGNDFKLYHDGTHGVLNNTTGNLYTSALGSMMFRTSLNVTALTLDASQNATFAGNVTANLNITAGSYSRVAQTTVSILSDAQQNSVLKFREDNDNYGFTLGYYGSPNNFVLTRHDNSAAGDTVMSIPRNSSAVTFSTQAFATTATSSGDASSTLTTKGYVDSLITGATIYRGAWQAGISATSSAATTASTTLTVTAAILDADGNTPVLVGAVVTGEGITGIVKVASVTSSTVYVLDTAITATATAYIFSPIYGAPSLDGVTQTSGYYYICSEAGSATPNGANSEPNTWNVGDWCIYNDVSGTGQWQKIDNSSVLSGAGTGQTVALWEGPSSVTDSDTLGNAPITVSGSDTTFAGLITGQDSGSVQLNLKRGSSGTDGNTSILFTQPLGNGYIGVDANGSFSYGIAANLASSKLKVDRSGNGTFAGTVTAPIFDGDHKGTINTATTGFTQTAGNNSTLIATTAYADAAAAAVPIGNYLPLSAGISFPLTGALKISENSLIMSGRQTGVVSSSLPRIIQAVLESSIETNNAVVHPYFNNDLGNFVARGGNVIVGGVTTQPGSIAKNYMFQPSNQFMGVSGALISGSTWSITILSDSSGNAAFNLNYGCHIGITFGSSSFDPTSMLIETTTDPTGATGWSTALNSSAASSSYVTFASSGGTGIKAIRFTMGYTSGDPRVNSIFAYNYSSYGMRNFFLGKDGGKVYGDIETTAFGSSVAINKITNSGNSYFNGGKVGIAVTTPVETLTVPSTKGVMFGYKRFYSNTGTVPAGVGPTYFFSATLNEQQGATLTSQYQYKFYLTTNGTGTYNSSVYIVYRNSADTAWDSHRVSSTGLSSNHPELVISGNNANIYNNHPSAYGTAYRVETSYSQQAKTSPQIFGSDYMWTRDTTDLYYMDGDVGIGVSSPAFKLDVAGAIQTTGSLRITTANPGVIFKETDITDKNWDIQVNNGNLKFYEVNDARSVFNEHVTFGTGGNVGIGFTSPQSAPLATTKLSVNGNTYVGGTLGVGNTAPPVKFAVNNGVVRTSTAKTYSTFVHTNDTDDYRVGLATAVKGGATASDRYVSLEGASYRVSTDAFTNEFDLVLNPIAGNVGIGTSTPTAKLDVQGTQGQLFSVTDDLSGDIFSVADISGVPIMNVNSNGTSYFDGNVGIGTNSPSSLLTLNKATGEVGILLEGNGTDVAKFKLASAGVNHAVQIGSVSNNEVQFHTANSEKMRLAANGNVGIGVTSPASKLTIDAPVGDFANGANAISLNYDGGSSPDDVGGGIVFSQRWWSASAGQQVTGGIFGIKNGANGTYGGGLAFYTQPNGASNMAQHMVIRDTGNVGIGTTNPGAKLEIEGDATADDTAQLIVASGGVDNNAIIHFTDDDGGQVNAIGALEGNMLTFASQNELVFKTDTSSILGNTNTRMTIDSSGDVGIGDTTPSYKLDVAGTIRATGDVIAFSDVRVKENIKTIKSSLDKVSRLRGVEFNKIGEDEKSIGVIAQEIEKVIPEVVKTDDEGMKSVAYGNISGLLIEAIKELKAEVDLLKSKPCNCNCKK
jgi:hypothetical protein